MDIKKIFATSKKRRGRSRYLLSVTVKVGQDKNGENGIDVQATGVHAAPIASGLSILSLEIYGFQGAVSIFYVGSLSKVNNAFVLTNA